MSDDKALAVAATPRQLNFRLIALIIATAMFMEQLDATILSTALPTMARDFGVTAPNMSIALTSYLLSLAIFIPASGKMADRFGSKTIFAAAIGVFTVGSILCAQAPNLPLFVIARFLQGIGGAMMMPVGRLVLLRSVERRNMVQAMAWLLTPALIGPIVGPPFGGFIVTYLNWRWIFYINVPIGLLGIVLVSLFIDNTRGEVVKRFDWLGMVLSGLALSTLFFGFEMTSHPGEGLHAMALLTIGLASGAIYLAHARRVPDPIMDFSLMKVPSFGTSVIAGSLTRITQGAQPFLLPLMLQVSFGLSAAQSGTIVLATAIGSVFMKFCTPKILRRWGFRDSLILNGVVATAGYAICAAFRPDWPAWAMFLVLGCCGFFMSHQFTAYNTIAFDEVSQARMSAATGFYSTFQQLMLSVGICVASLALQGSMVIQGHVAPRLGDFSAAFLVVTAISMLATIWNIRFASDAGTAISGHKARRPRTPAPAMRTDKDFDRAKSA